MSYVKFFFLVVWLVFPVLAKCLSGNCTNGYGAAIFPKGDIYTGYWKNGLAEGKGKLEYKNGNVFFGEWKNGRANGVGEMIYVDGTRYVGEWLDSQAHGYGTLYDVEGNILYRGKWENGKIIEKEKK